MYWGEFLDNFPPVPLSVSWCSWLPGIWSGCPDWFFTRVIILWQRSSTDCCSINSRTCDLFFFLGFYKKKDRLAHGVVLEKNARNSAIAVTRDCNTITHLIFFCQFTALLTSSRVARGVVFIKKCWRDDTTGFLRPIIMNHTYLLMFYPRKNRVVVGLLVFFFFFWGGVDSGTNWRVLRLIQLLGCRIFRKKLVELGTEIWYGEVVFRKLIIVHITPPVLLLLLRRPPHRVERGVWCSIFIIRGTTADMVGVVRVLNVRVRVHFWSFQERD